MAWWDVLERAGWTFIQAFVGAITIVPAISDVSGWADIANAGFIAGVGALVSFIKTVSQERLSLYDTRETAR